MNRQQFQVLYREFLFRMVDLEVLSAQGDIKHLLGQFGSILIFFSALVALGAMLFDPRRMTARAAVASLWSTQHFLIATTMLVMGLFAVLSWDSTFPDRRDVLVLAPLPVRARTMFLAKVAAVSTSLSLTVVLLHGASGLIWPIAFAIQATPQTVPAVAGSLNPVFVPAASGFGGFLRWFGAYWFIMLAS